MLERLTLATLVGALCCASCITTGTRFNLGQTDQEKLRREYVGNEYALASSVYVADFFGETDRYFIDARPFEILDLYHHDGSKLAAGATIGEIIPAGTGVRVVAIQYPVDPLKAKFEEARSELQPTAHTWMVVERTDPKALRIPLVMILPRDIPNVDAFNREVQDRLKSDQWVTQWLAVRPGLTLAGIMRKEPAVGMGWADLVATLGVPRNAADKEGSELLEFIADYGDLQVTVQGNTVTAIRSKKQDAAAAQQQAIAKAETAQAEATEKARAAEAQRAHADMEKRVATSAAPIASSGSGQSREAELQARLALARQAKDDAEVERVQRLQQAEAERRKVEAGSSRLDAALLAEPRKIGVSVEDVDPQLAGALGLAPGAGAFVTSTKPGGEAAAAGLQTNDIVVRINKVDVKGPKHFVALVASAEPKQILELEVLRRGAHTTLAMGSEFGPPLVVAAQSKAPATTRTPTTTATAPVNSSPAAEPAATAEPAPPLGEPAPASASLPWWQDEWHFGIQLHYTFGTTAMDSARRLSKDLLDPYKANPRDNATLFGFAHGAELTCVLSTPWIARVQIGAAGFDDWGSVSTIGGSVTGHAWAATVPILVGARLPFMERRLAATLDAGINVVAAAGLAYAGSGSMSDGPGIRAPGVPVGWLVRGGIAWHIIPRFAVTAELAATGLKTGTLVLRKDSSVKIVDSSGKPVALDFSGFGGRLGLAGYFF